MEINTININKAKNHLSPQLSACKNTTIYDVDSQGHCLGKAQTCSWFSFNQDFFHICLLLTSDVTEAQVTSAYIGVIINDLVNNFAISVSQVTTDIFLLS
jgi:hypothetical protein